MWLNSLIIHIEPLYADTQLNWRVQTKYMYAYVQLDCRVNNITYFEILSKAIV